LGRSGLEREREIEKSPGSRAGTSNKLNLVLPRHKQSSEVQKRGNMSSQDIWTNITTQGFGQDVELNVDTPQHKLSELRETVLRLLSEVNALTLTPPAHLKSGTKLYDEVRHFETNLIRSALSRTGGSQTRAAKLLGIKLTTLNSKIKRYHILPGELGEIYEESEHESAA
jgi:transcriptional regulator with GAF, ATPase, and Fis domain